MTFFAVAGLMLLLAAAAVALPLWWPRVPQRTGSLAANREVHARRLKELQEDLENGRLSLDDHAAARRDLDKDLAAGPSRDAVLRETRPRRATSLVIMVLMLSASGALYWFYGNWRVGAQGVEAASAQAVVDMVAALDKRLQTPEGQNDLQGWDMLGRAYLVMGRYGDALGAFTHARRLSNDTNAGDLAGYAEALAFSDPDAFMDKSLPIFEKALQIDPSNVQALWYGGLGALRRGDKALAVKRWNAILAQNPPADYRASIEKAITDAGGTLAATTAGVFISLRVSLATAFAGHVPPDTTVYIYAQPKEGAGGPPLAVRRLKLGDLPADLRLSDQDAVLPGRVLSGYDDVIVSARVAKNGDATPQAGDLIGQVEWLKAASKPLSIVIDTVVK